MYISHTSMPKNLEIRVVYAEEYETYSLTLGGFYLRVNFTQDEIETLYNEIMGAMIHRRFSTEGEVIQPLWEN
jgi:hypothetical protein